MNASPPSPSVSWSSRHRGFPFFTKPRPRSPKPLGSLPSVDRVEAMAVRSKKPPEAPPRPSLEELLARTDGYLAEARKVISAAREIITHESHQP